MRIAILGAGIAGVFAGYFLKDKKHHVKIFEASSSAGGLCKTLFINGCYFDCSGVHAIHSKNPETLQLMLSLLKKNYTKTERKAKIFYKRKWVQFPFTSDMNDFSLRERFTLYRSFKKFNGRSRQVSNYHDWAIDRFGKYAAENHYLPYARKIYKTDLTSLGYHFVEKTIPPPGYHSLKSILLPPRKSSAYIYFPKCGGIEALIKEPLQQLNSHILLNTPVNEIHKRDKRFIVNGEEFDKLICTLPITELPGIIKDLDRGLSSSLVQLSYLSLVTLLIGVKHPAPQQTSWFYLPGEESSFHRISFNSSLGGVNENKDMHSVIAEMTLKRGDTKCFDEEFVQKEISKLLDIGLIHKNMIAFTQLHFTKYAYILGDKFYEDNISAIKKALSDYGLILHGRFGQFEYKNMDGIIEDSASISKLF